VEALALFFRHASEGVADNDSSIDALLAECGGHPLALAVLGSLAKSTGHLHVLTTRVDRALAAAKASAVLLAGEEKGDGASVLAIMGLSVSSLEGDGGGGVDDEVFGESPGKTARALLRVLVAFGDDTAVDGDVLLGFVAAGLGVSSDVAKAGLALLEQASLVSVSAAGAVSAHDLVWAYVRQDSFTTPEVRRVIHLGLVASTVEDGVAAGTFAGLGEHVAVIRRR
jgi:hypothetical protein